MPKFIGGLLDRVLCVLGAFIFAQIPQFIQAYLLNLSGHAAELQFQVGQIKDAAASTGKSLSQLIQKFLSSNDGDFVKHGQIIQGMTDRLDSLTVALQAIQEANIVVRPFAFLRYLQQDIIQETFKGYHIGFSFTLETGVYALIGLVFGALVFRGLRGFFRMMTKSGAKSAEVRR